MGFNNGYDSGYSDCEAENRKRWENEAVERYKAENPGGGSSGSTPSTPTIPDSYVDLSGPDILSEVVLSPSDITVITIPGGDAVVGKYRVSVDLSSLQPAQEQVVRVGFGSDQLPSLPGEVEYLDTPQLHVTCPTGVTTVYFRKCTEAWGSLWEFGPHNDADYARFSVTGATPPVDIALTDATTINQSLRFWVYRLRNTLAINMFQVPTE